jgi:hypothetical protein
LTSGGKILIESKEQIKARLHRSTDAGDAVVQAFLALKKRTTNMNLMTVERESPWQ